MQINYTHAGASFARDFLEIEQKTRSDSNVAYDIKEFTSKLIYIPVCVDVLYSYTS